MNLLTGLTLLFVAAKLFGIVDWSWWIVFAPSIFQFGVGAFLVILGTILPTTNLKRKRR